jgi:NTP pyrophosphatase (non-canonical NTP hydrolase)
MQNAILSDALLKQQIESLHGQSVKNGFYDDYPTRESRKTEEFICSRAMLISGELHEAYEAFRSGKIDADEAVILQLCGVMGEHGKEIFKTTYARDVKGTVAEELADVYIRLCCVAGSVGIYAAADISEEMHILKDDLKDSGIHTCFYRAAQSVTFSAYKPIHASDISQGLAAVYFLADKLNIDLHKHVKLKAFYNTTREYKHGRKF